MSVQRARTAQEYADWVKNARFEVKDLRECLLYDAEEIGETLRFPAFLDALDQGIETLFQQMVNGTYAFGREDLSFMELSERQAEDIPFMQLLRQINETHRYGLDVPEED